MELSMVQQQQLVQLKADIDSLLSNFHDLLDSARLGATTTSSSSFAVDQEQSGEESQEPVDIKLQDNSSLTADIVRQSYESNVAANNILHACEDLLTLISNLKTSHILYDHDRIAASTQELSSNMNQQVANNKAFVSQLFSELVSIADDSDDGSGTSNSRSNNNNNNNNNNTNAIQPL